MGAMFDKAFRTDSARCSSVKLKDAVPPEAAGIALFFLLTFATVTVFVKEAWAGHAFEIGIFALLAMYLLLTLQEQSRMTIGRQFPWIVIATLIYLTPLWGVVQILLHKTASTYETRESILHWGALAAVFFLVQTVAKNKRARHNFLSAFLCFATLMAVLCLAGLNSANGSVLWIFPSGYPEVFATFPSHNSYAQFVELALPIALARALRNGLRAWWYGLAGGLLYASVVGAASRVGTLLCTAELLVFLAIGLARARSREDRRPAKATLAAIILIPAFASLFTTVVGWDRVWQRMLENDPYIVRREYLLSTIQMAESRPFFGFGLGTFPEAYQQFAIKDFPFYANHAHNDWAEFAADGGVPFLLLVLIPFAAAIPLALRKPWGLGIPVILVHACVDFPFPRTAVSVWIFALLGALYAAQRSECTAYREHAHGGRSTEAQRHGLAATSLFASSRGE